MNITPHKPTLPEDECIGEVSKMLHISRYKLVISEGEKVVQELSEVFARSSWRNEYETYYCLVDQLESELEAILDEENQPVECMRLMRSIINHARYEDCDNVVYSD